MRTAFWGRARACSLPGNRESLVCLGHLKRDRPGRKRQSGSRGLKYNMAESSNCTLLGGNPLKIL